VLKQLVWGGGGALLLYHEFKGGKEDGTIPIEKCAFTKKKFKKKKSATGGTKSKLRVKKE